MLFAWDVVCGFLSQPLVDLYTSLPLRQTCPYLIYPLPLLPKQQQVIKQSKSTRDSESSLIAYHTKDYDTMVTFDLDGMSWRSFVLLGAVAVSENWETSFDLADIVI